jgi:hypothetical protein
MTTKIHPCKISNLLATDIRIFVELKNIYDKCDPEIRKVVDDMCAVYSSGSKDEKEMALRTVLEALFNI